MNVSEYIQRLEALRVEFGDLPVYRELGDMMGEVEVDDQFMTTVEQPDGEYPLRIQL